MKEFNSTLYDRSQFVTLKAHLACREVKQTLQNNKGMEMLQIMIIIAVSIAMGMALIGVSDVIVTFLTNAKGKISAIK